MRPADTARARHRLYALLGQLLVDGPTAEVLAVVAHLPALPAPGPTLRADHAQALLLQTAPYCSMLRAPDGQLGGPEADRVRRYLEEAGFYTRRRDVEPDHLGLVLAGLGHLCAAEAEALVDGVDPGPARAHLARLLRLLDRPLADWAAALRRLGLPFWTEVAEMATTLVSTHRAEHPGPEESPPPLPDLDAPETGLRELAAALAAPAGCGLLLTPADLDHLADQAQLPRGFGPRRDRLLGQLFAAADLGQLASWTEGLRRLLAAEPPDPRRLALDQLLARLGAAAPGASVWDQRYAEEGFAYGDAPNDFLVARADDLPPGGSVLCLAEGEGRNAVWLARRGHRVLAVDLSPVGLAKCAALAAAHGVEVETKVADLTAWTPPEETFDAVISIWAHLPAPARARMHQAALAALRPGGVLLVEAYTPAQLQYRTGGPPVIDLLVDPAALDAELAGAEVLYAFQGVREVEEGKYHQGVSAVVQRVVRRGDARTA